MSSRPDDLNLDEQSRLALTDESVNDFISSFRQGVHEQAQRPNSFWTAQRVRIGERTLKPKHGSLGWAIGSVFATAAVAIALLLSGPATTNTPVAQKVDDDLLMREVVEATEGTLPDALAPATLLANEVDRGLETAVQSKGATR